MLTPTILSSARSPPSASRIFMLNLVLLVSFLIVFFLTPMTSARPVPAAS
ncbi:hypothetical protein [Arsenicicoccus cauae]|nr:hypothetical protein [Arsenicicoccus cauae]